MIKIALSTHYKILPLKGIKTEQEQVTNTKTSPNIYNSCKIPFKGMPLIIHPFVSTMAREVYNKTFDEMSELTKQNFYLNLLKPTLQYKMRDRDDASYTPDTNTINLNMRHLGKSNCAITSNPDEYFPGKGDTMAIMWNKGKFEKLTPDARYATLAERKADLAINFAHELSHARQMQVGLSLSNAKEIIAEEIKKRPAYKEYEAKDIIEQLEKDSPFIKNYKPQEKLATKYRLPFYQDGTFEYSAEDILRNLFSYNYASDKSNYAQIAEIDANLSTMEFIEQSLSKVVPELPEESKEKFLQEHGILLLKALDDLTNMQNK